MAPVHPESIVSSPRVRQKGGAGTYVFSGFVEDIDQNSDVRGTNWYGRPGQIGLAGRMERNAYVRSSLESIKGPLLNGTPAMRPATKEPIAIEIADFCAWALYECLPWRSIMRAILNYMRDGFSVFEITDRVSRVPEARFPNHPGRGSGVLLGGFHERPAFSIYQWHQSKRDPTKVDAITQWIRGSDEEEGRFQRIKSNRLLRFTEDQTGADYTGLATLRSAYAPWRRMLTYQIVQSIRHERQEAGTPMVTLPEEAGPEEVAKAEEVLRELRSHEKGFAVWPAGFNFEWATTNASEGTAIGDSIRACIEEIYANVGANFMSLGGGGSHGSYALAGSQEGQYNIRLAKHSGFIMDTITRGSDGWSPLHRLVSMNYGKGAADVYTPTAFMADMPTRDWSKILPTVNNLVLSGAIRPDDTLEAHMRKRLELPEIDFETQRLPNLGAGAEIEDDDSVELVEEEES